MACGGLQMIQLHYRDGLVIAPLDQQVQKGVFSVLNWKHGYNQTKFAGESQECNTMSTHLSTYKWFVLPMGLKNGNAAFEPVLDELLKDNRECARSFADDIIVSSGGATYEEAVQSRVKHIRLVLQCIREETFPFQPKTALCPLSKWNLPATWWSMFSRGQSRTTWRA